MRRRHLLTIACLLLLWPAPLLAQQASESESLTRQQAGSPPKDLFQFGVRSGIQALHYEENFGPVESDYDSFGYVFGANALLRIPSTRLRFGADFLGSFITDDRETWENVETSLGPGTQRNDLDVDMYVFDLDIGYAVVKRENLEWIVLGGWHYYSQDFARSNFFTTVDGVLLIGPAATVTEDVRGQGAKLGTSVEARVAPRLLLGGALAGYYLYDVDVKNSLLGRVDSDGYAARGRIHLDYSLTDHATIGLGYEGHYIHVDQGTSAIATLPENETWAHTVTLRLSVRY